MLFVVVAVVDVDVLACHVDSKKKLSSVEHSSNICFILMFVYVGLVSVLLATTIF